ETTDGLVAVEESLDTPRETSGNGAARFHGTIDETQRDVLRRQIRELADAPNAVDLRRPLVDVVDLDESYIEIDINALALPAGLHLFESLGHELFPRALPDHALLSSHHRVDGSVRLAGDVAVRQGIDGVAIRYETADRGDALFPLRVDQDREAAADPVFRKGLRNRRGGRQSLERRPDDAHPPAASLRAA